MRPPVRLALVGLVVLAACGRPQPAGAPAAAIRAPATSSGGVQDAALRPALACAAAGVAQQQALLAAAVKAGKTQMVGAMTGPMWAKRVIDIIQSNGGSQADAQAAIGGAIDQASRDATAGKPDLDEAALETCVKTATI